LNKIALIFGISGQDGSLLAHRLVRDQWIVHGVSRDAERNSFRNLATLNIQDKVHLHSANTTDFRSVFDVITRTEPSEIYNLGGQTSVGLSFEQPVEAIESITVATLNILEAIRILKAPIRFYNAASSECFGDTGPDGADETTPFRPRSPYAIAKAAAYWAVANYRQAYGLFASSGILFNHESPLRPERFVTQKIIQAAVRIARGEERTPLKLGNLDVRRDWGWAPDYIEAICLIIRRDSPEDFVIATEKSTALKEFAAEAFAACKLDWREHVVSVPEFMRPSDIGVSIGRATRARERLGWEAKTRMPELARRLAKAALSNPASEALEQRAPLPPAWWVN
jgi:GDPmannose 4,6-dehydratase